MAYVRFGNLSVSELEFRLGISFNEEHKAFLNETRTNIADFKNEENAGNLWHAFDAPFTIHCGSKKLFDQVCEILKSYMVDGGFPKEGAKIGLSHDTLEEEKFGYTERQSMLNENLEVYVATVNHKSMFEGHDPRTETKFFQVVKETSAGNIFLQELQTTRSPGYTNLTIIPKIGVPAQTHTYKKDSSGDWVKGEDGFYIIESSTQIAPIRKKRNEENVYTIKDRYAETTLVKWDGQPINYKF